MWADGNSLNVYIITEPGFLSPCPQKNIKHKNFGQNSLQRVIQMKPRFWPLLAHKCDIRTVLAPSDVHAMSPFDKKGHPHSLPPLLPDERLTFQAKDALSYLWSFNSGLSKEVSARGQVLVLSPLRSQQLPWVLGHKLNQISQLATW